MTSLTVQLTGVTKSFGPTVALNNVNLNAVAGEVHAIVGGNGSGKSTLAKVISGVLKPEKGQVSIFGQNPSTPVEARSLGIANVFQEVFVADECDVKENLFLGADDLLSSQAPDEFRYKEAAEIMLELLGFPLDPKALVGDLPLSIKQWITIGRAILSNPRLLILDESSASLDYEATERLFKKIREIKSTGCTIFIVTHRINELIRISDRATVLRDGSTVGTLEREQITEENILNLIAGDKKVSSKKTDSIYDNKRKFALIRMEEIRLSSEAKSFHFNLYSGEIVGVAGLEGQGQADFVKALAGIQKPIQGNIFYIKEGAAIKISNLSDARKNGIAYISGDRKRDGIFPNLSIFENMCISLYKDHSLGGFLRIIDRRKLEPIFNHETSKLETKMGDIENVITSLSGGNQQKILIARSFAEEPRVLVLNDPARGIDVGAKIDLYKNLKKFVKNGHSVVFLSSEIEEFLDLCDRVLVFRSGIISSSFEAPIDPQEILRATFGSTTDLFSGVEKVNSNSQKRDPSYQTSRARPKPRTVRLKPTFNGRLKMNQSGFLLLSPEFGQGSNIPYKYSENNKCSPALEWEGVPEGTKSFAISILDPDVPKEFELDRSFVHWLVYDIPPQISNLVEAASMSHYMPFGAKELNSDYVNLGIEGYQRGYAGPWPPDRAHRYVFTVYALMTSSLNIKPEADLADFAKAVLPVTIDQASFTAIYGPAKSALPAA